MKDQVVVLTGHAGGIGSAIATQLQKAKYSVIGIDRSPPREFQGESIKFDIGTLTTYSAFTELERLLEQAIRQRPVAALINNAAIQHVLPLREAQPADLIEAVSVNTIAPLMLFQALRNRLIGSAGTVVAISSIHTKLTKPDFGVYAMSKCATSSLTKTLSIEEGQQIRFIEINPGAVATPMLEQGFENRPAQRRQLDEYQPLGRIATPTEVAEVCVQLIEMKSRALNGTILNLDGGISALLHDPV